MNIKTIFAALMLIPCRMCFIRSARHFTATAVGLAIADGKLALTDKVIDFFPDKLPAVD